MRIKCNFKYGTRIIQLFLLTVLLWSFDASAQTISSFTVSTNAGCRPLNVLFTNTSANATSFLWNFGNGNTSTQSSPGNVYLIAGVYTVTLTANGPGGVNVSQSTITVANPPVADFTASQTTVCQNYGVVNFINSSTSFDSCVWDFGDGAGGNQLNPTHTYQLPGLFSVSLIVYNSIYNCSNSFTINQFINVIPLPVVNITTIDSITCDQNHVFAFTALGNNISQYSWSFGDGTSSTSSNPTHTYLDSGYYKIQLITTNTNGCRDTFTKNNFINVKYNPVPVILPSVTQGCLPVANQFLLGVNNVSSAFWDFGDGHVDSIVAVSHSFNVVGTFTVKVNVTYNNGCKNQYSYSSIQVDSLPAFTYTMTNVVGCAPLTVQFINNNSGANYNWLWDFGDGSTSTGIAPTHQYNADGVYLISLKATSQAGCSWQYALSQKVVVTSPIANFAADRSSGCAPLSVNFNNQSINATQYMWNFGDGTTSNATNPSHSYLQAGSFTVYLVAFNIGGCKDTLVYSQTINVSLASNSFAILPPVTACAPFTISFQDNSVSSSWLWNFGDGFTSNVQNPSHTYTIPGNYTVSLNTQGLNGNCSQNIANLRSIIINGGTVNFTHTESDCPPYQAFFQDSSINASAWLWSFDDGGSSTLQNPSHVFAVPGYHAVALRITTSQGCKATKIKNYEVYFSALTARVTTFVADTTLPISVQFYSHSVGATNWFWSFGDGDSSFLENPIHVYATAGPHTLTLTIWNDSCSRSYSYPPITFGGGSGSPGGNPVGTLPMTPIYNCAPFEMIFKNPFLDAVTSLWNFGDGQTSTLNDPTHLYALGGDYIVKLYVLRSNGVSDSVFFTDIIHIDKFDADFTISSSSSCSGTKVVLTPNDTTATCKWDLGNTLFLNTTIGHYVYPTTNSNFLISLVAVDTNGCSASASQTFYTSEINPLTVSASRVCAGDTLYFLNGGLNYGTYLWDFGDGSVSATANPFHVYQDSGIFQAVLTVSDSTGCSKSFVLNQLIQVFKPQANFIIQSINANCSYLRVEVINQSSGYDYINWNSGNGLYNTLIQPSFYYYLPGTYYISLTVSQSICSSTFTSNVPIFYPDLKADFNYTQANFCTPVSQAFTDLSKDAIKWKWSFGDGSTDTAQNPVHIYNSAPATTIKLIVYDKYGCSKSISKTNVAVTNSKFGMDHTFGCVPLTVGFSDSSSNAISWNWSFGDGNSSTLQNPVHQYVAKGKYSVQLIVESSFGCYDTLLMDSVIHSGSIDGGFVADVSSGCAPLFVRFTDQSPSVASWLWDFGDGNFSNMTNPTHVYNSPGTYYVKLIVTDTLGCTDTLNIQTPISIYGSVPSFSIVQDEGCTPFQLMINNQSIGAVSWEWNFGNGVTDSAQNPNYIYTTPGTYSPSLLTTDSSGCVSTYIYPGTIKVHQQTTAAFSINDSIGCTPFSIGINNNSLYVDSLIWNFGDGSVSNSANPTHTYNQAGVFTLSLYALSSVGCSDTLIYPSPISVNLQPIAGFSVNDSDACMPAGILFNNTSVSLSAPYFLWTFGNGDTSTLASPIINFITDGKFDVSLVVTNVGGCHDEISVPGLITIYDPIPPPPSQLYSISIIDTNQVEIKWKDLNLFDIDYYSLYRLNSGTGLYDSITSFYQRGLTTTNILGITDPGVNTQLNPFTYKVLATDKCGSSVTISQLTPHTSVFATGANNGGAITINWTSYLGCLIDGYKIFRSDDNGVSFTFLSQTDENVNSFDDTTSYCPFIYYYKVQAIGICNENDASGYSNTIAIDHSAFTWQQSNSLTRATVVNNNYVLVEWGPTDIMPQTVIGFNIFRSIDNINFPFYVKVNAMENYFEDYSVDVQNKSYYYKVTAFNYCNILNQQSNTGSSVLLKGDYDPNGKSLLRWSPYTDWVNGVDHYVLEKQNKFGVWEPLKTTDPKTTEADDDKD